jgi:hypothetical protein
LFAAFFCHKYSTSLTVTLLATELVRLKAAAIPELLLQPGLENSAFTGLYSTFACDSSPFASNPAYLLCAVLACQGHAF